MRVFGPAAYPAMIDLPLRLIVRAAELQVERDAEARLIQLTDVSLASGLKLGQEYVDPDATPSSSRAHYSLAKLQEHQIKLEKRAYPWLHTPAAIKSRREREEDVLWAKFAEAAGGATA